MALMLMPSALIFLPTSLLLPPPLTRPDGMIHERCLLLRHMMPLFIITRHAAICLRRHYCHDLMTFTD